jgi:hypothetical protein
MPALVARWSIMVSVFGLIVASVSATSLQAQRIAPVGDLLGGTALGIDAGAIVGSRDAGRCHSESCEGPFSGVSEMIEGGLVGAALGVVVGVAWPVRK